MCWKIPVFEITSRPCIAKTAAVSRNDTTWGAACYAGRRLRVDIVATATCQSSQWRGQGTKFNLDTSWKRCEHSVLKIRYKKKSDSYLIRRQSERSLRHLRQPQSNASRVSHILTDYHVHLMFLEHSSTWRTYAEMSLWPEALNGSGVSWWTCWLSSHTLNKTILAGCCIIIY